MKKMNITAHLLVNHIYDAFPFFFLILLRCRGEKMNDKKKKYEKSVGSRVEAHVYEFVKKKGISVSDYIRRLIEDDMKRSEDPSTEDVNSHVNAKENYNKLSMIHEELDQLPMPQNMD